MTGTHYLGAALVLALIAAVGLWAGRKVESASDFTSGGHRAGAGVVAGLVIGTLVGGASTIGTAQLAFAYGFSAWWFTLGGGMGCLVLAVVFSGRIYRGGANTLPAVFTREYGPGAGMAATLLTSAGSFLSIVSQVLSGVVLISAVSGMTALPATGLIVLLMLVYVIFGGVWGAGYVGMAKTVLLCVGVSGCGLLALWRGGGVGQFVAALPAEQYFNFFARGVVVDLGAGLSLVLGILTTQAFFQALQSARTLRVSRAGVLAGAVLMPLIGVGGVFVGMYMRLFHPEIDPGSALPLFIMEQLPPLLGGVLLATLLVALVGTGAGVSLGLSSMLTNDLYKPYWGRDADDRRLLRVSRLFILLLLVAAALFSTGNMGSLILDWSFLSMGLRGAVAFGPLCTALFLPGRIPGRFALASMVAGPALVIIGKFTLPAWIDPLFPGVAANLLVLAVGLLAGRGKRAAEGESEQ